MRSNLSALLIGRACLEPLEPRRLLSFSSAVNYSVGSNPQAVATADLNEDGRLDLVTSNATDNTISVRLGNGSGGFGAASHFDAWLNPDADHAAIAIADFTGDSDLDVVTVQQYSGTGLVSLLPGNGDGTFDQAVYIGGGASAVVAGHFNADTKSDLAISWYDYDAFHALVQVYLSNGQGGFTYPTPYKLADGLETELAVGDINGDGKLDAVLVIEGSANGWALIGKGDGTFIQPDPFYPWPGYEFPVGPGARDVALGDFTGDGKLDAVVAGADVTVMRGRGDGRFDPPISHSISGNAHTGVATGDFNADGKLDAVVTDENTGTVSVMLGNGDGTLRFAGAFVTGSSPSAIAVGDFNGDGRPDVAAANGGSNNVSVLLNDGNWATKTFIGSGGAGSGGNWANASNWSPTGAPAAGDHVTIAAKSVNLSSSATVAGLTLTGGAALNVGAAGNRIFRTSTLAITGSGSKLNLNDNDLIVDHGSYTSIRTLVIQGFGSGASGGITSSTSNGSQILALFDNARIGATQWAGQTLAHDAVVGKYTYFGDANFDGRVTGDDYGVVDAHLGSTPAVGMEWISGDMNFDGFVTGDDYGIIDAHLGLGITDPLMPNARLSAIPEPTAAALTTALLLARWRRSSTGD